MKGFRQTVLIFIAHALTRMGLYRIQPELWFPTE
jgi:hypothetical protein